MEGTFETWGNFVCKLTETGELLLQSQGNAEYKYGYIRCKIPPQSSESHKMLTIQVSFDGGETYYDTNMTFEYLPTPVTTSMSPDTIYSEENVTVSIYGSNFDCMPLYESQNWFIIHTSADIAGNYTVIILELIYINSTLAQVDVPMLFPADGVTSISPLDIVINMAGHTTFNHHPLTLSFYNTPPEIVSIHPYRGPVEGNTIITVNAQDLEKQINVYSIQVMVFMNMNYMHLIPAKLSNVLLLH